MYIMLKEESDLQNSRVMYIYLYTIYKYIIYVLFTKNYIPIYVSM